MPSRSGLPMPGHGQFKGRCQAAFISSTEASTTTEPSSPRTVSRGTATRAPPVRGRDLAEPAERQSGEPILELARRSGDELPGRTASATRRRGGRNPRPRRPRGGLPRARRRAEAAGQGHLGQGHRQPALAEVVATPDEAAPRSPHGGHGTSPVPGRHRPGARVRRAGR